MAVALGTTSITLAQPEADLFTRQIAVGLRTIFEALTDPSGERAHRLDLLLRQLEWFDKYLK